MPKALSSVDPEFLHGLNCFSAFHWLHFIVCRQMQIYQFQQFSDGFSGFDSKTQRIFRDMSGACLVFAMNAFPKECCFHASLQTPFWQY